MARSSIRPTLGLCLALAHCGGGEADEPAAAGAAPTTGVSELRPASEACVDSECPEVPLFGAMAPGCCQVEGKCGGRIALATRSWLCVSPVLDGSTQGLQNALSGADEPIVLDASCPDRVVAETSLPGCCSAGATCGVSSQPWVRDFEAWGVRLARRCLGADELDELDEASGAPQADAGPPLSCARD